MSRPPHLDDDADAETPASGRGGLARVLGLPRWILVTALVLVLVISLGSFVRVPYYSLAPGPTRDMVASVQVTGTETYPSEGKLLLTTAYVSDRTLNVWEYLVTVVDPSKTTIAERLLLPDGVTPAEQEAKNIADMEASKLSAELAAFRALGCRPRRRPGVRVLSVVEGSAADGHLRSGDLVVAINGREVRRMKHVAEVMADVAPGERVRVRVVRGERRRTVRFEAGPARDDRSASLGIYMHDAYRLPFAVDIDSARVVGPSGGLVFALSLVEVLTRTDLTRGRVVAVTGTIDPDGTAGAVGGVPEKVRGAAAAGATVFLAPPAEADVARGLAPEGMEVVAVETLADAVRALHGRPIGKLAPRLCRSA